MCIRDRGYCPLHQYDSGGGNGSYDDPIVENTLIPDARQLLQSAYDLMASMDGSSQAYLNIQSAASNLETVITSSNPSTADVAAAMAMLTQAMAGGF